MQLAKRIAAVHLRIDTIEQAMRDSGVRDIGPKGYNVAYKVAYDNLTLGLAVISDSVNPLNESSSAGGISNIHSSALGFTHVGGCH